MNRKAVAFGFVLLVGSALGAYFAFSPTPQPSFKFGYSTTPCAPVALAVPNPTNSETVMVAYPASISYHIEIWNTAKPGTPADTSVTPSQQYYICNELVVNAGLDWLAKLDGQNSTGSPVYMTASTASSFLAADTSCTSALTTNGFTKQNTMSTYAHTGGTNTYTIYGQWTYTASTSTTVAGACLETHSSGAANALVDESATSATATVNANGDVVKITATITV